MDLRASHNKQKGINLLWPIKSVKNIPVRNAGPPISLPKAATVNWFAAGNRWRLKNKEIFNESIREKI